MSLRERVYSVLVVSSPGKFNASLASLLPEKDFNPIDVVQSVAEAQRTMLERQYDLIIINTPLCDDFGTKFAINCCSKKNSVVMLVVKTELYDEINAKTLEYGVMTVRKPTSLQLMNQAFDHMCAVRERLRGLEDKNVSLEEKMAEIRLVSRAKWLLIDNLKMTETDAHRYIEKQAMDRCVRRREIAESIIKTYT